MSNTFSPRWLTRRKFDDTGTLVDTHGDYVTAVRQVAAKEYPALPKGRQDDTHFCVFAASRMCDLAVAEIKMTVPELARYLSISK